MYKQLNVTISSTTAMCIRCIRNRGQAKDMAAMASTRAWLSVRPHVPLIKFRKGGITGNDLRVSQSAPPTDSGKGRLTVPPKPIIEDWQLPKKYQRQPLSDLEIEYINSGGPPITK